MKYSSFLFLVIVCCSCATNKNSGRSTTNDDSQHEFIAGDWVHTYSLNKLKAGDLTYPQPFTAFAPQGRDVYIRTCYTDGKPYHYDLISWEHDHVERIDDAYVWMNKDSSKVTLRFSIQENDTVMIYERQYKSLEPYVCSLSKAPWDVSCGIQSNPRRGYFRSYHQLYFEGKYQVREIATDSIFSVEITPDYALVGLPGFDSYGLDPHNVLLFKPYQEEIIERNRMTPDGKPYPPLYLRKNEQSFSVKGHENGFDLYTHKSLTFIDQQYLEKVYEFRRE